MEFNWTMGAVDYGLDTRFNLGGPELTLPSRGLFKRRPFDGHLYQYDPNPPSMALVVTGVGGPYTEAQANALLEFFVGPPF